MIRKRYSPNWSDKRRKMVYFLIFCGFLCYFINPIYERSWLGLEFIYNFYRPWKEAPSLKWNSEYINLNTLSCGPYNLKHNPNTPVVFDAFMFFIEFELLEIRLNILNDVVDYFVIVEAEENFNGEEKELHFKKNREKFSQFADKICHVAAPKIPGVSNWEREKRQRLVLKQALVECHAKQGDLVIFGDLDEIPRPEVVSVLKQCTGYSNPVDLGLREYLFSFEWENVAYYPNPSASLWTWNESNQLFSSHFLYRGPYHLSIFHDAGWHCSWCYKYIEEFQWKMKGTSHSDMYWRPIQHEASYIQDAICSGTRLESPYLVLYAYSYKDLIAKLLPIKPALSMVNLPKYLIENQLKFKYLLPGGCKRELHRPEEK